MTLHKNKVPNLQLVCQFLNNFSYHVHAKYTFKQRNYMNITFYWCLVFDATCHILLLTWTTKISIKSSKLLINFLLCFFWSQCLQSFILFCILSYRNTYFSLACVFNAQKNRTKELSLITDVMIKLTQNLWKDEKNEDYLCILLIKWSLLACFCLFLNMSRLLLW